MIAALKDRNEQLANTIDSLNSKIAELQNEAPTKSKIDKNQITSRLKLKETMLILSKKEKHKLNAL